MLINHFIIASRAYSQQEYCFVRYQSCQVSYFWVSKVLFVKKSCLNVTLGWSLFTLFNVPLSFINSFSSCALQYYLIKIVLVACHSKNYFVIIYLLEDKQELSLGMLIRIRRIYNFWCSMLVYISLSHVFIMFTSFWNILLD